MKAKETYIWYDFTYYSPEMGVQIWKSKKVRSKYVGKCLKSYNKRHITGQWMYVNSYKKERQMYPKGLVKMQIISKKRALLEIL